VACNECAHLPLFVLSLSLSISLPRSATSMHPKTRMTARLRRGRWKGFGSEASLFPPFSCGFGSEPSSPSHPPLPPPLASAPPPTPPLGLNLWDVVVAKVLAISWVSALAQFLVVFSGCCNTFFR